jgi:hypothetical protein
MNLKPRLLAAFLIAELVMPLDGVAAPVAPDAVPCVANFEQPRGKRQGGNGQANAFGAGIFRIAPERAPQPVDTHTALIAGLLFGSPDFQRF